MAILLILLVALPFVELAVLVRVAGSIGVLDTLGLLVVVSIAGAWLARRAGVGAIERMRRAMASGRAPDKEAVDGALILLAGALLLIPGFVSDALGIALLIPPIRAGVRTLVLRRLGRSRRVVFVDERGGRSRVTDEAEIWDAESWEDETGPSSRGPERGEIGGG